MESFIEENIRDCMWSGKIPIKIDMATEDINDVEIPNSLYVISTNKFLYYNKIKNLTLSKNLTFFKK